MENSIFWASVEFSSIVLYLASLSHTMHGSAISQRFEQSLHTEFWLPPYSAHSLSFSLSFFWKSSSPNFSVTAIPTSSVFWYFRVEKLLVFYWSFIDPMQCCGLFLTQKLKNKNKNNFLKRNSSKSVFCLFLCCVFVCFVFCFLQLLALFQTVLCLISRALR